MISHALQARAVDGDVAAVKLYLEYTIGKPRSQDDDPGNAMVPVKIIRLPGGENGVRVERADDN